MNDVWPIILMVIAGFLVGGVISMIQQKRKVGAVIVGVLAVIALGGAVLWWWPNQ